MSKLIVNTPSGVQELIQVGEGGGYFDPARVVWDERKNGPLPAAVVVGGLVFADGQLVFSQARMDEHVAANTPPVPTAVTMRQARLALLAAGKLAAVTAAINALPSPQKEAAQIEWEYSQEVQRHNGFVSQLGPVLGLDAAALDALFVAAAGL